jgi:hypothetical protein
MDMAHNGSDSASNIQSRNSDSLPEIPQHDSDSNATEAESNGQPSEEQIFDGQSGDSDQHTPAQKSKLCGSLEAHSEHDDGVGPSDQKAVCQTAMSFSSKSVTSAASSGLAFNGSLLSHGTRIMLRKKIMKKRLPELWQSLCMMRGWKSPRE